MDVISNRTRAARSFDFEIMHMISDQIALHSVQLPLLIKNLYSNSSCALRIGMSQTRPFGYSRGVRQGFNLSPLLFN